MLRYKTETRPGWPCTTSGQETGRVNFYNPGVRTGPASFYHFAPTLRCQFQVRWRKYSVNLKFLWLPFRIYGSGRNGRKPPFRNKVYRRNDDIKQSRKQTKWSTLMSRLVTELRRIKPTCTTWIDQRQLSNRLSNVPNRTDDSYSLRPRRHDCSLTVKADSRETFLIRQLFKDM